MHQPQVCLPRKTSLTTKLNVGSVEIINMSTSVHKLTNMACHYWRRFLIQLAKPRCLTLWIYDLDITNYHYVKVIRSRLHIGALTKMGRIICINGSSYHLGWKMLLQNSKGWWIGCLQAWILSNATLMTSACLVPTWKNIIISYNMCLMIWECMVWNNVGELSLGPLVFKPIF
jgi:hypothetical protein